MSQPAPREIDEDLNLDTPDHTFLDLEALLADAVKVADARKLARKQGTRTAANVLAIVREADVELSWDPQYSVARFVETHCTCGASHRTFDSWYMVSQHRREPTSKRFLRTPSHQDLPSWQYVARVEVEDCAECLTEANLPFATIDQLMGVDALGEPADCCLDHEEQQDLFPPLSPDEQDEENWIEEEEAVDDAASALFEELENV